jgi:predicted RNA-binding protein with RPS1 domain
MSKEYVADAGALYKLGDTVHVRVTDIDPSGKIRLSMLSAEDEASKGNNGGQGGGRGERRPQFSDRRGGGRPRYDRGR